MQKIMDIIENLLFLDIIDSLSDGLLITDHKGVVLCLNDACANFCKQPKSFFIGKDVYYLESIGIFNPSVSKLVIEKQQSISTVQMTTASDSKFIVTGYPIKNEAGKIQFIISQTKDITEIVKTTNKLEETQVLLQRYSEQVKRFNYEKQMNSYYFAGQSDTYNFLLQMIDKIAKTDSTVLLTGETGVGKSVLARRVHDLSERSNAPFIEINCGAIPDSLIESELFGYVKGAFTGANKTGKPGLIKLANSGTVFLDEIGELPIHLQAKLLQFLQQKKFLPIGASKYEDANVRIIAATNLDLLEEIKKGNFRSDLYYRLNVLPIHVPSLRGRPEDITSLIQFNLNKFNEKHKRNCYLSSDVMVRLQTYDWPGNIRELENLLERLIIIAPDDEIKLNDLPNYLRGQIEPIFDLTSIDDNSSLTEVLDQVEQTVIAKALSVHKTTRKTADALGITQSSLMRRLKKYQLNGCNEK